MDRDFSFLCVVLFSVFVVFGLIIFLLIVTMREEKRKAKERLEKLQNLSRKLSFSFVPKTDENFIKLFSSFDLFNIGHSKKATNLFEGSMENINWKIFDYLYVTGSGKHRRVYAMTVFCAYLDDFILPRFSLGPESFFDKIGNIFGFDDIDFAEAPKFSDRYLLKGEKPEEIRAVFNREILKQLEDRPFVLNMEANENIVLLFSSDPESGYNIIKPENIAAMIKEHANTIGLFRSSVMGK